MRQLIRSSRHRIQVAGRTTMAAVARLLIVITVLLALSQSQWQIRHLNSTSKCRSIAAVELDLAEGERTDALSDLQETVANLFDASLQRDNSRIQSEGAKLPLLSSRIHVASIRVNAAREQRALSIETC